MELNLSVPSSWSELTQPQLRTLLMAVASANLHASATRTSRLRVAVRCILVWNGLRSLGSDSHVCVLRKEGREYPVSVTDIAAVAGSLEWISSLPETPVRLDVIDGAKAAEPDIEDLTFNDYLSCETLWQVWQTALDDDILVRMARILYRKPDIRMKPYETVSIFYWWAGVKNLLTARYHDFFRPAPVKYGADVRPDPDTLRRNMDAQIRALTKGDITKEDTVLAMPVHRALTELDALAREYEELDRKYPQK